MLVPVDEARKPKVAVPPAASRPFQSTLRAVTVAPDWVTVAFHAWLTAWPLANVKVAVQPVEADEEPFLTMTSPWKPPVHCEATR